jgi:hypothetical protein
VSDVDAQIRELIDRETRAWDTKDVDLLLSVLHEDMVWPWPPNSTAHDPAQWVLIWGRFTTTARPSELLFLPRAMGRLRWWMSIPCGNAKMARRIVGAAVPASSIR